MIIDKGRPVIEDESGDISRGEKLQMEVDHDRILLTASDMYGARVVIEIETDTAEAMSAWLDILIGRAKLNAKQAPADDSEQGE